ncbi:MAG: LysR family transcriptional regulator [Alphaproteobacteria bacterium]|jgi:DNA-binding transcriptional LysR family regulator|nr:LysR family transcriptional regulator [Alphaproteobacteria bacterium]
MYDWDDLRIFLSVARHKSFQGAADQLGLDPTTIGRRMARLEQALNCTLVARGRSPGFLTTNGKRLFEAASRVEMATEDVRTAIGETSAGVVRISTSEGFGATIIAPAVAQLVRKRPRLQIEIVAMPGFVSPAMREVDITITLTRPQDRRLSIEKLTDYMLGLYAAPDYLARRGVPEDPAALRGHVLVGYIDDLLYANELRYLDEVLPGLKPTVSSSSIRAQMEAMIRGAGLGVLPSFMAEREPGLVRILPDAVAITRTFWLAARRDVLETARVRQVTNWIHDTVAAARPLLLPDAVSPAT